MSVDGEQPKNLDRGETYVKTKRNLLFITSATIVIFFSGGTSIKIPGLSDTDGLPKGLAMFFLLIAIVYFAWEFWEEYRATTYRNNEFSFDYRGSNLEAKLAARISEITNLGDEYNSSLSGIMTGREVARQANQNWEKEVEHYTLEIRKAISELTDHIGRNMQSQIEFARAADMKEISQRLYNMAGSGLTPNTQQDAEKFFDAIAERINSHSYDEAFSKAFNNSGFASQTLLNWQSSMQMRGGRLMEFRAAEDYRLQVVSVLLEKAVVETQSLDRSISKLARNIRREQVVGHRWRDGWGSIAMTGLAVTFCLIEIIDSLTPDFVKNTFWTVGAIIRALLALVF